MRIEEQCAACGPPTLECASFQVKAALAPVVDHLCTPYALIAALALLVLAHALCSK